MEKNTTILKGGLTLASGDVIVIKHNAGDGTTFSYTAAVDFIITNMAGVNWGLIMGDNWVSNTSGVYGIISSQFAQATNPNSGDGNLKLIIPSGTVLGYTDADFDSYGAWLIGIEL